MRVFGPDKLNPIAREAAAAARLLEPVDHNRAADDDVFDVFGYLRTSIARRRFNCGGRSDLSGERAHGDRASEQASEPASEQERGTRKAFAYSHDPPLAAALCALPAAPGDFPARIASISRFAMRNAWARPTLPTSMR